MTTRANRFGEVLIPGSVEANDQTLSGQWVADVELRARPIERLELAIGSNNVFDSYPDRVFFGQPGGPGTPNYGLNGYFLPYSSFSPSGFNGRFLYLRAGIDF